nr:acylphosphatase-like isoform X1 [Ipomoea batatas]
MPSVKPNLGPPDMANYTVYTTIPDVVGIIIYCCWFLNPNSHRQMVRAVIKGRVQGVFYRDWTVENAKELGLKGWVRNRRDGTVEALFSGSPEKVEEMEQRCRRGPPAAMVTGFDVFPCNDDPGAGFERRSTA